MDNVGWCIRRLASRVSALSFVCEFVTACVVPLTVFVCAQSRSVDRADQRIESMEDTALYVCKRGDLTRSGRPAGRERDRMGAVHVRKRSPDRALACGAMTPVVSP